MYLSFLIKDCVTYSIRFFVVRVYNRDDTICCLRRDDNTEAHPHVIHSEHLLVAYISEVLKQRKNGRYWRQCINDVANLSNDTAEVE